jgi:hypothetical protein
MTTPPPLPPPPPSHATTATTTTTITRCDHNWHLTAHRDHHAERRHHLITKGATTLPAWSNWGTDDIQRRLCPSNFSIFLLFYLF